MNVIWTDFSDVCRVLNSRWQWWILVGVKAMVVNPKQVDVAASRSRSFRLSWNVLIAHCTRPRGALSETVATVSLSTVPRLSLLCRQCCRLGVGKRTPRWEGGRCRRLRVSQSPLDSPCVHAPLLRSHGIKWLNQMTWHLYDSLLCRRNGQFWLFWGNRAQKDSWEHCDGGLFGGSQPRRWRSAGGES